LIKVAPASPQSMTGARAGTGSNQFLKSNAPGLARGPVNSFTA
jgi:hypothetical protein